MPIESMKIYSCPICGNALIGMEWEEDTGIEGKEFRCAGCGQGLNEDELYSEED